MDVVTGNPTPEKLDELGLGGAGGEGTGPDMAGRSSK